MQKGLPKARGKDAAPIQISIQSPQFFGFGAGVQCTNLAFAYPRKLKLYVSTLTWKL